MTPKKYELRGFNTMGLEEIKNGKNLFPYDFSHIILNPPILRLFAANFCF